MKQKRSGIKLKRHLKEKSEEGKKDSNTILLIDCSTIVYAAFYTYGTLNYHGKPTGIVYGFLKKMLMLAKKFETTNFITCWDAGVSHRHSIYTQYKANRIKKRENESDEEKEQRNWMLAQSIALNHRILPYLGFKNNYIRINYEADDLLAYWVNRYKGSGKRLIMVTTDSDMFQCLDNCSIFNPSTKKLFTRKKFIDKYGIKPGEWAMAKAIGGCSGDNVKGVEGVSDPKKPSSKALKYLRDELVHGKIYDRIKTSKELIQSNLQLVSLPYDNNIPRMLMRRNKYSRRRFIKIFDKNHFKSFLEKDKFVEWEEVFLNG